jgi:hypothetical protein
MNKQLVRSSLLVVSLVAAHAGVTTDTISIHFAANEPAPFGSALAPTARAGAVESANWNNASNETGTLTNLVRDTGGMPATTAASVTWSATNTWSSGSNDIFLGDNHTLMLGYLDQNREPSSTKGCSDPSSPCIRVTINDVPDDFQTYDVYVYFLGDAQHRGGVYTVNGVAAFGFVTAGSTGPAFVDAGQQVPPAAGNYLVFSGLSERTISITADNDVGFRAPLNAVQIVNTPSN